MAIDFEKVSEAMDDKPINVPDPEHEKRANNPTYTTQANTPQNTPLPPTYADLKLYMDNLREEIKRTRILKGYTQRDLAARCGYSQGTITRAEKRGWISIDALMAIVYALDMKITLTPK